MMKKLFRFMRGYLEIELSGRKAGRFFNLCTRNGMQLWNVSQLEDNRYLFCVMLCDYRKVRPIRRKTHVRLTIRKRLGFPFQIWKYRRRFVFPAALLAAACALWCLSGYIWKIDIRGNSFLTEETLTRYLQSKDWGYGTPIKQIDCAAVELSLRRDFSEVIWASSYIKGTMLVVEIQENIKADRQSEEEVSKDACVNIAAQKNAVIASIITRNGTPLVKAGDTVNAGDLLVTGQESIIDDNGEISDFLYIPADADIMGYVIYEYADTIPAKSVERETTGESHTGYFVEILGKNFSFPFQKPEYDCSFTISEYRQLKLLDNFYLPIYLGKEECYMQQEKEIFLSDADAKTLAEEHLTQFLEELEENGVSITDKNVIMERDGDYFYITGSIDACEPIGVRQYSEQTRVQKEGTLTDEFE